MRITLIAQASSAALRTGRFPAGEPLDDRGRAAAAAIAVTLPPADWIAVSPDAGARDTAEALGLDAVVDPAWRDLDHGRWAGRTLDEVADEDPQGFSGWLRDPGDAPHGGETVLALLARVAAWLDGREGQPARLLVVSHPAPVRAAIVHAMAAGPGSYRHVDVAPLTQATLTRHDGLWRLRALQPWRQASS